MKAMILAAGRGERMRPLTDTLPKPLLKVGGKALIQWHIERLAQSGIEEIVINHAYRGEMIAAQLGDGRDFGVNIRYSPETEALETAGGIANALHLLGEIFLVVNADVYCDFDFTVLTQYAAELADDSTAMAHLVLVDNPVQHPDGDFALSGKTVQLDGPRFTFSGIALYRRQLFDSVKPRSKAKLAPLLVEQIKQNAVRGEHYSGRWVDVGTPERLADLDAELNRR